MKRPFVKRRAACYTIEYGVKVKIPNGYKIVKKPHEIKKGDMYYNVPNKQWTLTMSAGCFHSASNKNNYIRKLTN